MDFVNFLIKCICCVTGAAVKVDNSARSAEAHGCCIPIKCFLEIKDCYDHCTSEVGVESTDSVQMSGSIAPVVESMA